LQPQRLRGLACRATGQLATGLPGQASMSAMTSFSGVLVVAAYLPSQAGRQTRRL
jgi:hypothetical protein